MTSHDVPAPASGPPAGRRRALGRGPGASAPRPAPPVEPEPPAEPAPEPESAPKPEPAPEPEAVPEPSPAPGYEQAREPEPSLTPTPTLTSTRTPTPTPAPEPVRDPEPTPRAAQAPSPEPWPPTQPDAGDGEPGDGQDVQGGQSGRDGDDGGSGDDTVFKVRLANFEGPFDLLLQLIAKHKLDVTEVALSKVTDEFMTYIRAMGSDWDLDETTEFLVVAATLLDLKAARLLPAAEVEDEADLALLEARDLLFARLLQYRAYKRIADIFSGRLDAEARRYPRTVGLEPHHAELLPEVVISTGAEGFARLAVKAMQPRPKPQVYVDHIHAPLVSVQEQAGIVVARLRELGEASFRALVEDTDDTLTVVARFLALLELYREKAVALDQETALGELLVRWTGGDEASASMVTDEFDRPPERPEETKGPKEPEEEKA
ncbi:segregation and condensation protein A [Streptomyces sp. NPDC096152]|uniref:segregation and condensation protein A n=1 Tax=Streptomyces sp. NPDC096152 TaxID=3366078 RepID=UPI0037F2634C